MVVQVYITVCKHYNIIIHDHLDSNIRYFIIFLHLLFIRSVIELVVERTLNSQCNEVIPMLDMLKIKQSTTEIESKRTQVTEQLAQISSDMKSPQLASISTDDLRLLFEMYDEMFFLNWFRDYYKGKMKFSLSKKMTRIKTPTLVK